MNLNTGIYYQDILSDGTRSVLRQAFPQLKRVSFDKRPPVAQTLKIEVTDITELPSKEGGIISHHEYKDYTRPWSDNRPSYRYNPDGSLKTIDQLRLPTAEDIKEVVDLIEQCKDEVEKVTGLPLGEPTDHETMIAALFKKRDDS